MSLPSPRCFLCGARAFAATDRTLRYPSGADRHFALACGSCGVLVDDPGAGAACRADLAVRLRADAFACDDRQPYGLDIYTLLIAATAASRGVAPVDDAQRRALREPHSPLAAECRLFDLSMAAAQPVALGILCRPAELAETVPRLPAHALWADDIVLLVDGPAADPASIAVGGLTENAVRIAARPLAGDFAAQRNALTALSPLSWMLQLDADETLAPETGALLGALASLAEASGAVSIGFARRNFVDGVLSDLHPDTQYRLNHHSVLYAGRVHERPRRDWRRGFIALHGPIDHHLNRVHVETRSLRYDAMDPGRGRLDEASRLLEPYRP